MASITSLGLGSGLDLNGIVTKLMTVESQPLNALVKKEAGYQAKLSAFGSLKGALSSLQTAAGTLKNTSTFTGMSATGSDSTVLTASAAGTALAGTYDIAVSRLAKAHIISSSDDHSAHTFQGGTLSITVGTGTPVNISLTGPKTLAEIGTAINEANAGVTAAVVNDGTVSRLVLTAKTTGAANTIDLAATDTGGSGTTLLSALVTDVENAAAPVQAAQNAELTVNGLAISRSANTITDVIAGVTLNLAKEGSSKLTVAKNTGSITSAINAFVKAYNDAIGQIKTLSAYDAANKKASILTGDATVRSIQSDLAGLVQTNVSGVAGSIGRLSDIGITIQKDGTLTTDSTKLSAALADPAKDVASLFTRTTSGNEGIAVRFNSLLENIVGTSGIIAGRTDGINTSIKSIDKQRKALELRLEKIETRYRAQFAALDSLIASMNQTSTYLSQQLANLPSISSSKN